MSMTKSERVKATIVGYAVTVLVLSALPALAFGWTSYTYRFGDRVQVTYGQPCSLTKYRGNVTTTCGATWTVDGVRHRGEITDDAGENLPHRSGVIEARVWGDTARHDMHPLRLYAGLLAPPLFVPALIVLLVLLPPLVWSAGKAGWEEGVKQRKA
jgi:hypothetical protein